MKQFFKKNMGNPERILRISLGTLVILAALFYSAQMAGWVTILFIVLGAFGVLEGLVAWCPLRAFLGLDNYT